MMTLVKIGLAAALLVAAGIFLLFFQLYQRDVKALTDFSAAYAAYDQAFADFSKVVLTSNPEDASLTDQLAGRVDSALKALQSKSSTKISSLIKNEKELMRTTREIGDRSSKEIATLKAYRQAVVDKSSDQDRLANELTNLTRERKAGYLQYLKFAEMEK